MVDWSNPTLSQLWSNFVDAIKGRDVSAAKMDFGTDTNLPTGALRYNRTTDEFQEWNGSTWTVAPISVTTVAGSLPGANIADDGVTNAKLSNMAQATIKGRAAGAGTGDPQDLDAASARTALGLGAASLEAVATGGSGALLRADGNGASLTGIAPFPTGTRMVFHQTAAPTGWTKDTTANLNDTALRVVTGTVNSRTNQSAFSTVFGKSATDGHALSISEMPLHGHPYRNRNANENDPNNTGAGGPILTSQPAASTSVTQPAYTGAPDTAAGHSIGGEGGGAAHTHGMDIRINYHDVIIAAKA